MYGVPIGNEVLGRTLRVTERILPVVVEIVSVAGVSSPLMTARLEARTVMADVVLLLRTGEEARGLMACGAMIGFAVEVGWEAPGLGKELEIKKK